MRYPVIHISFGRGVVNSVESLNQIFLAMLDETAKHYRIGLEQQHLANRFSELIQNLHAKFEEPVVILVDEYDKPILDNIEKPDLAIEIREGLRNIYSVIKTSRIFSS